MQCQDGYFVYSLCLSEQLLIGTLYGAMFCVFLLFVGLQIRYLGF